jgi:hypothetical protein
MHGTDTPDETSQTGVLPRAMECPHQRRLPENVKHAQCTLQVGQQIHVVKHDVVHSRQRPHRNDKQGVQNPAPAELDAVVGLGTNQHGVRAVSSAGCFVQHGHGT